jgi:acetolactate synthase-1/2/3 large subunit
MTGSAAASERPGGHLVAESLAALGAEVAFGVPGVHALSIWDGLRDGPLRTLALRTELCSGFAADGYARASGRPAPLVLSTGPGALNALTALMEAASAHVPVVAISSQEPRALLGRGRGYLHELRDQLAVFAPVVKHAARAESAEGLPELLAAAWRIACTPPTGPVYVEIPVDVLEAPTRAPSPEALDGDPPPPSAARPEAVAEAARLLAAAERPCAVGRRRRGAVGRVGGARHAGRAARRAGGDDLHGQGRLPADHPLSAGSGCDEAAFQALLTGADVVLAVGTELGAETTGQYRLAFEGRLIHLDAAPERIGATYPALALAGDARATLAALLERLAAGREAERGGPGAVEDRRGEGGSAGEGGGGAARATARARAHRPRPRRSAARARARRPRRARRARPDRTPRSPGT